MLGGPLSALLFLSLSALVQARVRFLGVAIAGGEFGCGIDGTCSLSSIKFPLSSAGGADGQGQMKHFVKDDGLNMFRLTTSWQYLTNSESSPSSKLDAKNAGQFDELVQACLATGAYCMIELHNFARFNGAIIGQGGPSDAVFVALWTAIATKYAKESQIVFELMNEPHDLDVGIWAKTCQKVVTAIRGAGATSQLILLPGTNFDSAGTLVSTGSADALLAITNPDGSTDGLALDVHKYLDVDNSGSHAQCVMNNVDSFDSLASYLRTNGRQALVSETGASSDPSCLTDFCAQNAAINANADVYLGYVAWGAGSLDSTYVLSLTPSLSGSTYVDNKVMKQCVLGPYQSASPKVPGDSFFPATTAAPSKTTTTTKKTSTSHSTTKSTSSSSSSAPLSAASNDGQKNRSTAASDSTTATSTSSSQPTATHNAAGSLRVAQNLLLGVAVGAALL